MLPHLHWRVVTVAKLNPIPCEECVPKSLQHDTIIHGSALDENRIAVNLTIVRIRLHARGVKL